MGIAVGVEVGTMVDHGTVLGVGFTGRLLPIFLEGINITADDAGLTIKMTATTAIIMLREWRAGLMLVGGGDG